MIVQISHNSFIELPDYLHYSTEFPVLVTDLDGIIRYVNKGYTIVYGYPADEIVGCSVTEQIEKSDLEKVQQIVL